MKGGGVDRGGGLIVVAPHRGDLDMDQLSPRTPLIAEAFFDAWS